MPLKAAGKKAMANMVKEYGQKRGKKVFYATANSNKKFAKAVGEKR